MSRSENLTVMFTDIVGYTEQTARLSREGLHRLLRRHDEAVLPVIDAYRGRRVKAIGDALLVVFRSPTDAVQCGMAIQDALAEKRAQLGGEFDLHLRVALSQGDVRVARRDVHGEAVNVASRIEAMTPPDEVYFSEAVYLAMNKAEIPSAPVGEHGFKGIPEKVRVYCVPPYATPRLVPGETTEPGTGLPFGGAHLNRPLRPALRYRLGLSRPPPLGRRPRQLLLAGAAVVLAALLLRAWLPELSTPAVGEGDAARDAADVQAAPEQANGLAKADQDRVAAMAQGGDLEALKRWLGGSAADVTRAPLQAWARGHLAFAEQRPEDGLEHYRAAVEQDTSLAAHELYARNLVSALGWKTAEVEQLIDLAPSEEVIAALGRRSGESGFHGRYHARRILEKLGAEEAVHWFDYAREELKGRESCKDRRAAVRIFRRLSDPRAIEIIEAHTDTGFLGGFKDFCLADEARETLKELRAKDS